MNNFVTSEIKKTFKLSNNRLFCCPRRKCCQPRRIKQGIVCLPRTLPNSVKFFSTSGSKQFRARLYQVVCRKHKCFN
jgi:hypothetical protein